jgi:hypothetical protein
MLMTTRAGVAGLLTGLAATALMVLFSLVWPQVWMTVDGGHFRLGAGLLAVLLIAGGILAVHRSRAAKPWRCVVLGALAGGLAGTVVFCLWGAAVSGIHNGGMTQTSVKAVVEGTVFTFFVLFSGGAVLGGLGGMLCRIGIKKKEEVLNREDPQMAMNAAITALPASVFAAALAAVLSKHLTSLDGMDAPAARLPLLTALLLTIVSHFALMMVVPHEVRMAEHRCGTDEVKMAALVSLAAAPVLVLLLFLIDRTCFSSLLVDAALLLCLGFSLRSLYDLVRVVLPKRASFLEPQTGHDRAQAILFGSIAESKALRLIVLCTGCGLAMMLPLYVSVVSVLVNLTPFSTRTNDKYWQLILCQALTSTGMCIAAVAALVVIYMFYLNLGRRFSKK